VVPLFLTGLLEVAAGIGLLMSRYAFYAAVPACDCYGGAFIAHVTVLGSSPRPRSCCSSSPESLPIANALRITQQRTKNMITISVIVGSTREGRFSEKPAQWILQHLQRRDGIEARLLDLRDFPMPFFDQAVSPATPGRAPVRGCSCQTLDRRNSRIGRVCVRHPGI